MADPEHPSRVHWRLLSLLSVAAILIPVSLPADDGSEEEFPLPGRDVQGVLQLDGQPVDGAVITICDAVTGVPLIKAFRRVPKWGYYKMAQDE